jgi:hypothetical protein
VSSETTCTGPVFDGRAAKAARAATEAARADVATEGQRLAAATLEATIRKHGTGRAARSVTTTSVSRIYQTGKYTMPVLAGSNETLVTSDLASYGPWLEGTGSRNLTTRFKGHFAFRLAAQELGRVAGAIADKAVHLRVWEMN